MPRRQLMYVLSAVSILLLAAFAYILWSQSLPMDSALRADGNTFNNLRNQWELDIRSMGPEAAYQQFLVATEGAVTPEEKHTQAHLMGEALYNELGLPGISYCEASFEFGCYHSFFASAVDDFGIEVLPAFKAACQNTFGENDLPCQHGIGHGILIYTGYEKLEEALVLCESIQERLEGGCVSGVFMEYNFHTMAATETGEYYLRPLREDVYEPCNQIAERFAPACYFEQVQWWQNHYSNDFKHIGTLCSALEGNEATTCFQGIGNYVSAYYLHDEAAIHTSCNLMPNSEAVLNCHLGAAWLIRGDGSGYEQADSLCRLLDEETQPRCIENLR